MVGNNACMQILLSVIPPLEGLLQVASNAHTFVFVCESVCHSIGGVLACCGVLSLNCTWLRCILLLPCMECHFQDLIDSINGGLELQVSGPGALGYGRTVTYSHGCCRLLTRLYSTFQKLRIYKDFVS
jgi:hypothetical protein